MKKGWKIFWISIGSTAVLGAVLCIIALAMGVGWRDLPSYGYIVDDYTEESYDNYSQQEFSDVKELEVDINAGQVFLQEYGDTDVRVESVDSVYDIDYDPESGKLKIETKERHIHDEQTLYIYIPADYQFEEVDMDMGAGRIQGDLITADTVNMSVGAGQIAIALPGSEDDYNYQLVCAAGEIEIGGNRYAGLANEKKIDNGSQKNVDIECGAGAVYIDFIE